MLRWIDELNGVVDADATAKSIKAEIRQLKKETYDTHTKRRIRQLYANLDSIQFKPDYMCLIIDKEKDYWRACKGFSINGISYKRLLGTNGGIKNSTIVFVSERLHGELSRRIDNGRDMNKKLVPAKLEAYKALTCSASTPVSWPKGILVVHDVNTTFFDDTMYLDDECEGEPSEEYRPHVQINMDASDGYGLMLPSLAARWSEELGLDYVMCGCNTRACWEKGMVFSFDFVDFAENVAHNYIVKDVWGNDVDVRDVELIYTESMLKLWDSYDSLQSYLDNCLENRYTIGIPKVCPKELENERTTNYQFIQSYHLSDEDIDRLIAPTMDEIRDILDDDWRKTLLYLKGIGMNENNVAVAQDDWIKAIMVNPEIANDPYIKNKVYQLIKNRINEAKVGVLNVHGNYSMVGGDPFSLCQSIFGLEVTGLLKSGEIYNRYWEDAGAEKVACFRAPMSTHENVRILHPVHDERCDYWFQYLNTCTILNSWDNTTAALNGCDFDGDLVMLTDNDVLVNKHRDLPTIMCVQRKAEKIIPTEEDTIKSNIASFGNEIGQVTNRITSMYDMQSKFDEESEEYKVLAYRIRCGQLIQQNTIDKAKGIISKPMPREWYDKHSVNVIEDEDKRRFYRSIVADRKPYFMRYIYPDLMKQYNTYIKNTNRNALREFGLTVDELQAMKYSELTDQQKDFLRYYDLSMPVSNGTCVMNRICRKFENEFDGIVSRLSAENEFDYTIMKSGVEYSRAQYIAIGKIIKEYNARLQAYSVFTYYERVDSFEELKKLEEMKEQFIRECDITCHDDRILCDILLDICYKKSGTKKFVWDMCAETIIRNMLEKNGNTISYPALDSDGEIKYGGRRFTMKTLHMEENDGYNS